MANAGEALKQVAEPRIRLTVAEREHHAVVSIADNGKDIPKKDLRRVFEPFYSTKPMASNWGIGLSHCQKIMEAFGGAISIDSVENGGTTIDRFLPRSRQRSEPENGGGEEG